MYLSGKRQHRVYESETVTRSVYVCLDVYLKSYQNWAQEKTHQNISNGYPVWQGSANFLWRAEMIHILGSGTAVSGAAVHLP